MIDLGFVDVSAAVVGSTYQIDWSKVRQEPTLVQMERGITDHLAIYNESGAGFLVTFNQSNGSFTLPAGGWAPYVPVGLPGNPDLNLTLTVEYILPNAGVSQVHSDYFLPGEVSRANSVVLGNSPTNVSGGINLTSVITALVQITGTDTWTIQEDGSGNLIFTDTTTGNSYTMNRAGYFQSEELALTGISADILGATVNLARLFYNNTGNVLVLKAAQPSGTAVGISALTWDGTNQHQPMSWGTGTAGQSIVNNAGAFAQIAGQVTAGSFGTPVVVAEGIRVTATGALQTLLTFTPPAIGMYRMSGTIAVPAGHVATATANINYTDPDAGAAAITPVVNTGISPLVWLSSATLTGAISLQFLVSSFLASTATAITFTYQDTHATPASVVSAYLERLS